MKTDKYIWKANTDFFRWLGRFENENFKYNVINDKFFIEGCLGDWTKHWPGLNEKVVTSKPRYIPTEIHQKYWGGI